MARKLSARAAGPMLPRHRRWNRFVDRLVGAEGCDVQPAHWTCFGDLRFTKKILEDMGLDEPSIQVSITYFKDHGGYCDCEVLLNVAHAL